MVKVTFWPLNSQILVQQAPCKRQSKRTSSSWKKNKQFIKLCHKYIHNINEDILQIYIILQYTYPFRRESSNNRQCCYKKKRKTNAVVLQILKEHSLTLDSVTHVTHWYECKKLKVCFFLQCDSEPTNQWNPTLVSWCKMSSCVIVCHSLRLEK